MQRYDPSLHGKPPHRKFHYSGYWHRWSRRLLVDKDGWVLEVNLEPIPGAHASTWENNVAPIVLRRHITADDRRDLNVHRLPYDTHKLMGERLGFQLRQRLITGDLVSEIDFDLLRTNKISGGTPLAMVALHG